jgi:hypothetical protein
LILDPRKIVARRLQNLTRIEALEQSSRKLAKDDIFVREEKECVKIPDSMAMGT